MSFWHHCLLQALKVFSNNKDLFQKLLKYVMIALARAGSTDSGFSITSAIVNWVLQRDGIEQARELYKRYATLFFCSIRFCGYIFYRPILLNLHHIDHLDCACGI